MKIEGIKYITEIFPVGWVEHNILSGVCAFPEDVWHTIQFSKLFFIYLSKS